MAFTRTGVMTYVVHHGRLRRVELNMVGAARGRVDQPAGDPAHKQAVINAELNGALERLVARLQHGVQLPRKRTGVSALASTRSFTINNTFGLEAFSILFYCQRDHAEKEMPIIHSIEFRL